MACEFSVWICKRKRTPSKRGITADKFARVNALEIAYRSTVIVIFSCRSFSSPALPPFSSVHRFLHTSDSTLQKVPLMPANIKRADISTVRRKKGLLNESLPSSLRYILFGILQGVMLQERVHCCLFSSFFARVNAPHPPGRVSILSLYPHFTAKAYLQH